MLRIEGVYKSYKKIQALNGLDMEIRPGALYGFIGPNGAGKTTTIKIITGLLQPDQGQVYIDGIDIKKEPEEFRKKIGYVPDFFGVYDNLKVSEYMEFFASCYGMNGLKARQRYTTLLEQVGLEDRLEHYADGLSRGMKQRLCLARALIHDPKFLIMDEPTSGLPPRSRIELWEILQELCQQGKSILISSHILSDLSEVCTDIGIIEQGKMLLSGNMKEILGHVNTSNSLMIGVLGDPKGAVDFLKRRREIQSISIKGCEIVVGFLGDKDQEAQLLYELIQAQIPIYTFAREQGSLESVFLQITSEEEKKVVLAHEDESSL